MRIPCLDFMFPPGRPRQQLSRAIKEKIIIPYHNVAISIHPGNDVNTVIRRVTAANLVPAVGRNMLAWLLANRGFGPSSIGVGTDNTPTTDATIQLGCEIYRELITTRRVSGSTCIWELFLSTAEANGSTLQEAGVFADQSWYDGDVMTGGGFLFSRVVHSGIDKTSAVSVTYRWEIPISAG